jgi:hypothetical protein
VQSLDGAAPLKISEPGGEELSAVSLTVSPGGKTFAASCRAHGWTTPRSSASSNKFGFRLN